MLNFSQSKVYAACFGGRWSQGNEDFGGGYEYGHLGEGKSSEHFGSGGFSDKHFGNHQFGDSGDSGHIHYFKGSGKSSQGFGTSGGSDLSHHHSGMIDSELDTHHEGLESSDDQEGSLGGSSEFSGYSSGLDSRGGSQTSSSGSGHSPGKSLGSSVVSVGHFDFDEHSSAGNDDQWKGLK
ncbi:unnamed protein product [Nezara viridula]|uniref:Uncharacterized protein n=1 Tax=Nezara viridula TaxID=85310 RepID=A0A9P0E954_NEZVI|nr:unnamed protein product [Nezara viridula]